MRVASHGRCPAATEKRSWPIWAMAVFLSPYLDFGCIASMCASVGFTDLRVASSHTFLLDNGDFPASFHIRPLDLFESFQAHSMQFRHEFVLSNVFAPHITPL